LITSAGATRLNDDAGNSYALSGWNELGNGGLTLPASSEAYAELYLFSNADIVEEGKCFTLNSMEELSEPVVSGTPQFRSRFTISLRHLSAK
jgi:hypothetical protein